MALNHPTSNARRSRQRKLKAKVPKKRGCLNRAGALVLLGVVIIWVVL